ncbi:MAG: MFS transporter [Alphaproteobacteria bacterium]
MSFLANRAVNLLSLHYAFQALAQGSGGVFLLVYLLKAGLTLEQTIMALAATVALRFIFRRGVVSFARQFGLKAALVTGCLILSLQYPLSAAIDGVGWALLARCVATGAGEAFYWSSFHAFFASLGDSESRCRQVGAREALAAAIGIIAPLFGAWALMNVGAGGAFALIGLVQALGIVPLLWTSDVKIAPEAPGMQAAARTGRHIYLLNGWFAATFILAWQVALFLALGESLSAYGGTMALAAVAGAAGGLMVGHLLDEGRGAPVAVLVVFAGIAAIAILRAASLEAPALAIAANAIGAFAICFYVPVMNAPVYNLAKASPCALRFHVATEDSWDIGCIAACALALALLAAGLGLSAVILLALASCLGHAIVLHRYYTR